MADTDARPDQNLYLVETCISFQISTRSELGDENGAVGDHTRLVVAWPSRGKSAAVGTVFYRKYIYITFACCIPAFVSAWDLPATFHFLIFGSQKLVDSYPFRSESHKQVALLLF
jgi:hypothetical protein